MKMWDDRYQTEEYVYGTTPNEFLVSVTDQIPKGKVLCLAEGEGRNAVYLAGLGHEVVAVDSSSVGLEKAKRLGQDQGVNIKTVVADLTGFQIKPNSWYAIISIFCHLPSELREDLHKKVVNGLRPGGVFVLEAYTPAQLKLKSGGPSSKDLMMSLKNLEQELEGLIFIHSKEIERAVIEGKFHTGKAAVVQILAVKP